MAEKKDVVITYLEQSVKPTQIRAPRPTMPVALLQVVNPPIHYYRYLYDLVGGPYHWVSRKRLADADLARIIQDPRVYIYVLYVEGVPGGFCELDHRDSEVVEIKFFGLAPEQVGRGLGRYFLGQCIGLAWQLGPERVQLETCTLDHPAALPLYQKLGFNVFDTRRGQVELLAEQ